jgi:hypothetical protein
MSKLISTTIKEQDIGTYNLLRQHLDKVHMSMGTFIIQSYNRLDTNTPLRRGENQL